MGYIPPPPPPLPEHIKIDAHKGVNQIVGTVARSKVRNYGACAGCGAQRTTCGAICEFCGRAQ